MSIYACNSQISRHGHETANADPDTIRRYASLLTYPVEVRVVNGPQGTLSGYFDDPDRLAAECEGLSGGAGIEAVYTTLNPVHPDLLARSHNRIKNRARHTTSDPAIARRMWLPIDCDSVRPAGISATDGERDAALEVVARVTAYLAEQGFPAPVLGDSGNGGHALYRVDLPNTSDVAEAFRRLLEHLAKKFDTPRAKLDTKVYNASRVWKVYGTRVQKGDEVGGRRHRLARLLDVPAALEAVPFELIAALAGRDGGPAVHTPAPAATPTAVSIPTGTPPEETFARNRKLADQVVRESGLGVYREKEYAGGVLWVLDRCPFCDKADRAAHVAVQPDGKLCFACKHSSCRDKYQWKDFRAAFDTGYSRQADADLGWIEEMIRGEGQSPAATPTPAPASSPPTRTKPEKRPNAERLVAAAREHGEWFVTPEDVAHVRRTDDPRGETMKVQSAACRRWLVDLGVRLGFVPGGKALADAQLALEAAAFSNKVVRRVYLRFARLGDTLFVDLADPQGRVVEVAASGWRVVTGSPVAFVQPPNLAPLPGPSGAAASANYGPS